MAPVQSPLLLASVEALFADSDSIVVAAFQAHKLSSGTEVTGTQLLKALGGKALADDELRSVVIAFTVKRSLTDRGFLASIHFARPAVPSHGGSSSHPGDYRLQLRKSHPLKSLHDLRVTTPSRAATSAKQTAQQGSSKQQQLQRQPSMGQQQQVVEVRCASHHAEPEFRASYLMPDNHSAMFLASLIIQLLRQQDAVLPGVGGVSLERLDAWWSSHKEDVTNNLTPFALEVITPGAILVGRGGESSIPVSDKEAGELEELLQLFELGLGESTAFAAALQEEAAALEAANVYAILESGSLVEGVVGQLRHTQTVLDDLDESLKVFDFKLRHMRDDIAAIEASNNSLERQARHNRELLMLLEGLLGGLHLDQGVVQQLEQTRFELIRLPSVASAAWQLHQQRVWLSAAGAGPGADRLNPLLTHMRVVREAQLELDQITGRFVSKGVTFLLGLVGHLLGEVMADAAKISERAQKLCPPGRARVHDALKRCAPLIQVIAVLDPKALQHLQQNISADLNNLLRHDIRVAAAELRRGAAADLEASSKAGCGDYSLAKERGSSAAATAAGSKRLPRLSIGSGSGGGSDSISDWTAEALEFTGPAAAGGSSAAKREAFLDGSATNLPLHEAWSHLLEGFLPFLADEAAFFADMLLMYRGDSDQLSVGPTPPAQDKVQDISSSRPFVEPGSLRAQHMQRQQQRIAVTVVEVLRSPGCPLTADGVKAVDNMMSGLEAEFVSLVDLATKSHQVLLLPLLAITRSWQQRLGSKPPAAPLLSLLGNVCTRVQGLWGTFKAAQLTAVEQYEARSKMGLQQGIKHIHVLPLVSQFCLMAHDLEVALVEGLTAAAGPAQQQQQTGGQEEGGGLADTAHVEAAAAAAAHSVRQDADGLYDELCPRLLSRLERVAASDAKYAERCRLENYSFLGEALRDLASTVPALQQHWQVAESRRESALTSYVTDQLQYSKFWKLLEFADKLDKLLQVVSPPEVSFQKDCSPAEVRSLIRSTMDGTDKKLEAMVARVRKHLGGGTIFNKVWATIKDQLIARYEHLEWLLEQCYPTTPLRPSPEELRELFKITSAG